MLCPANTARLRRAIARTASAVGHAAAFGALGALALANVPVGAVLVGIGAVAAGATVVLERGDRRAAAGDESSEERGHDPTVDRPAPRWEGRR